MTINPAGVILVVIAVVAIMIGIKGTESASWQAIFGTPAKGKPLTPAQNAAAAPLGGWGPSTATPMNTARVVLT